MQTFKILYTFHMPSGNIVDFDLELDGRTLTLLNNGPVELPYWTNLDFHQCPNCPLSLDQYPRCPLAVSIVNTVKPFDYVTARERIKVEIRTDERTVVAETTAQAAVSSMLGLVIAASGCPHASFFKPMARFHLPLASPEETLYRAACMYMLAQHFLHREGRSIDLQLKGLHRVYENIHTVNVSVADRLRAASKSDSAENALVLLDMSAVAVPHIFDGYLDELRHLFTAYFENGWILNQPAVPGNI